MLKSLFIYNNNETENIYIKATTNNYFLPINRLLIVFDKSVNLKIYFLLI